MSVAGPLLTQIMMKGMWSREKAQIAFDNAAIALGREERSIWNALRAYNQTVEWLEIAHDVAHSCAKIPSPIQPQCQEEDVLLEHQIDTLKVQAEMSAKLRWQSVFALVESSAPGLETDRPSSPPLVSRKCRRCQREVYWEKSPFSSSYNLRAYALLGVRVLWVGRSLREKTSWDYEIQPGREP